MEGLEEWGSRRRIDFLTPNTFTKKIILVSTVIAENGGQTATTDVEAINYLNITKEISGGKHWKVIKKHKTFIEAMKFHEKYVNKLKLKDSKKC